MTTDGFETRGTCSDRSRPEQPPRGDAGALCHCGELRPHHIFRHPAHSRRGIEAAVGAGQQAVRIADRCRDALDALGHDLGMLDEVGEGIDHAGNDGLIGGRQHGLEQAIFMGVARIRERQDESADRSFQDDRKNLTQRHVAVVRGL